MTANLVALNDNYIIITQDSVGQELGRGPTGMAHVSDLSSAASSLSSAGCHSSTGIILLGPQPSLSASASALLCMVSGLLPHATSPRGLFRNMVGLLMWKLRDSKWVKAETSSPLGLASDLLVTSASFHWLSRVTRPALHKGVGNGRPGFLGTVFGD